MPHYGAKHGNIIYVAIHFPFPKSSQYQYQPQKIDAERERGPCVSFEQNSLQSTIELVLPLQRLVCVA